MIMETIAVIFGGRSAEHDVSIITALSNIVKPLELTNKYQVEAIYITKDGSWLWDDKLKDIKLFTSGKIQQFIEKSQPVSVRLDGGMTLVKDAGIAGRKKKAKIDLVFPSMHGTYGEDGALMGLLDMANIPYVGCGVSASAVAMDKVLAKRVAESNQIPVSHFLAFTKYEINNNLKKVIRSVKENLNYPIFVKPTHLGSSIGISKASNDDELKNGLEVAIHYDDGVLVEEAVNNLIEVTLPIMGNEQPKPALLEQPLATTEDFFDFDTKYLRGGKKGKSKGSSKGSQGYSKIPADLPKSLYDKAENVGLAVYKAFGCSGIARVDMLIDKKSQKVYFNEVNPLPGGLYAHNWNKAGVSNISLVQQLVEFAKERYDQQQTLTTTFSTNYLKQF